MALAIFYSQAGWFESKLLRYTEEKLFCEEAHFIYPLRLPRSRSVPLFSHMQKAGFLMIWARIKRQLTRWNPWPCPVWVIGWGPICG